MNPFEENLGANPANYQPLTPLSLLARAAHVWPEQTAVIHGNQKLSYQAFYTRCRQLASALTKRGIGVGDTVSVMLPNVPPMLEAHYGVPMTGAVLHSMNTRLDAGIVAFQLDHANTKVLITDRELAPVMREALALAKVRPLIIDYDDLEYPQTGERLGSLDYEAFVAEGDPAYAWRMPENEWEAIGLNYTSGTTGNPKGVVVHHRGAAFMCFANVIAAGMVVIPSICGRCRCSTATAGHSRGRYRPSAARTSASAPCAPSPSTT